MKKEIMEQIEYHRSLGHIVPGPGLIKTEEQIEGIRRSCRINNRILDYVQDHIKAGITTQEIDDWMVAILEEEGATSADYLYDGFPKHLCVSIDDVVCHGIPSPRVILKEGMIVNVDISTVKDGYYSDASRMFIIGETTPEKKRLVEVTRQVLEAGQEAIRPYGFVGDIGYACEQVAIRNGYKIVRDFGGHGVGLKLHEEPFVHHYGKKGTGMLLVPGMCLTIEPMVNMKKSGVYISRVDGWTVRTKDKLPSAQWEHTFLVTEDGYEILSQ